MKILFNGLKAMKEDLKSGNIKKQIPNMLTFSRLFSPFILIPLAYYQKTILFLIMLVFFMLTDTLDGYFARRYQVISQFGAYLDAIVDKVFIGSLIAPLIIYQTQTLIRGCLWAMIFMEIIIASLNFYVYFHKQTPASSIWGKIKTSCLFITLAIFYLSLIIKIKTIYLYLFAILTIIFEFIAIISYFGKIKKDSKKESL